MKSGRWMVGWIKFWGMRRGCWRHLLGRQHVGTMLCFIVVVDV